MQHHSATRPNQPPLPFHALLDAQQDWAEAQVHEMDLSPDQRGRSCVPPRTRGVLAMMKKSGRSRVKPPSSSRRAKWSRACSPKQDFPRQLFDPCLVSRCYNATRAEKPPSSCISGIRLLASLSHLVSKSLSRNSIPTAHTHAPRLLHRVGLTIGQRHQTRRVSSSPDEPRAGLQP